MCFLTFWWFLGCIPAKLALIRPKMHLQHDSSPFLLLAFSSLEPTILLACGRNRELWEQPFRTCAIDEDLIKPDGQNSVISFVISKWLLPELSIPAAGQKDRRLWGREGATGIAFYDIPTRACAEIKILR